MKYACMCVTYRTGRVRSENDLRSSLHGDAFSPYADAWYWRKANAKPT